MSDRIFAIAWLGVCLLIAVQMWNLVVPFSYEPLGPKAFPLLLAGLMAACCVILLFRPDHNAQFPTRTLLRKGALLIGVLFAYAFLFERVGFPLSTAAMAFTASRIYGGSWISSAVSGSLIAILAFAVFDGLLNVGLPTGLLWSAG
jgi:putative tricarboxylic transport membrane protein